MSKKGAEVQIPLKLKLETDEALKDLEKFSKDTKANISAFSAAKRILDGLEKSMNKTFDGKNVDKLSGKLLQMQDTASKSAKKLMDMHEQFKEVFGRQQIRDEWSSPEKTNELVTTYQAALDKLRDINAEFTKIATSGAREGIGDLDYYKRMVAGYDEARNKLHLLLEQRRELEQSGGKGTDEWKRISEAITSAKRSMNGYEVQKKRAMDPSVIETANARWAELEKEQEKVTETIRQFNVIQRAIQAESTDMPIIEAFQRLATVVQAADLEIQNVQKNSNKLGSGGNGGNVPYTRGFYLMRTILRDISKGLDNLQSKLKKFTSGIASAAKHMLGLGKESKKITSSMNNGFNRGLRYILQYGLGIRSLYFLFRRLRKYAKEALDEMAKAFPEVNTQMSRAATALNQMKGAIGTAIQPLLNVVVPVLEKIANLISRIMSLIGGVFATLTGQGKIYSAVATQTDYAASLEKTGSAAKKAKKELEGYLSPIDEINKYQSKKDDDSSGGGADGPGFSYVETEPSALAKKVSDIIKRLIDPIKKAWANAGEFVKYAWKRALNEILKLGQSIARDFWKVWEQPETQRIFENIFRTVGWIGIAVGNLARNFREAWDENNTGLKILEAIRDIILIITEHIKDMAKETAKWADKLDFSPFLNAFKDWLESLEPVIDNLMGVLEDFYTKVILPLGKWAVEVGSAQLLKVFTDFNNEVDWEGLREKLSTLWEHLEPFAERVGEGLIMFIDDIADKLTDFLNSDTLGTLIDNFNEFMDSVTAKDVNDKLWDIVNALVALKGAAVGIEALSKVAITLKEISMVIQNWSAISGVLSTLGGITAVISGVVLAVKEFFDMWTNGWDSLSTILEALGIALATIGVIILAPIEGAGVAIAAAVGAIVFAISQIAIAVHDNWDSIVAWYEANIKPAIDSVKEVVSELIDAIVDWWNNDIKPIIDSVGQTITDVWHQYIEPTGGYIKEMVQNLWTFIKAIWEGNVKPMLQVIGVIIQHIWNTMIKPVLGYLKEGFTTTFRVIGTVIETAVKFISSLIQSMMQTLNGVIKFITGVFTGDWTKAWEGLKDIFKGIINGIISIFEAGINLIVSGLNAIQIPVPWDWAQKVVGASSIGFNVSTVSLPRLAQGAVIPPNKEFMAVLGDQKNGTNIETPLDTMIEAFNAALSQNNGGGRTEINFLLPDRRRLAQYVVEGGRIIQTSTGRNPFELA